MFSVAIRGFSVGAAAGAVVAGISKVCTRVLDSSVAKAGLSALSYISGAVKAHRTIAAVLAVGTVGATVAVVAYKAIQARREAAAQNPAAVEAERRNAIRLQRAAARTEAAEPVEFDISTLFGAEEAAPAAPAAPEGEAPAAPAVIVLPGSSAAGAAAAPEGEAPAAPAAGSPFPLTPDAETQAFPAVAGEGEGEYEEYSDEEPAAPAPARAAAPAARPASPVASDNESEAERPSLCPRLFRRG